MTALLFLSLLLTPLSQTPAWASPSQGGREILDYSHSTMMKEATSLDLSCGSPDNATAPDRICVTSFDHFER